jgi:phospholipase/lecithinase/hemolysin
MRSNHNPVSLRLRQDPRLDSCLPRGMMTAEFGSAADKKKPTRGDVQMIHKLFPRAAFALAACCSSALVAASAASAAGYSAEYVFGDSLSDRGNIAEAENVGGLFSGNFPDPPSNHDSFTNGPVAVQLLANSLGLNADPSLWLTGFKDPAGLFPGFTSGTNYAVGGATSSDANAAISLINLPEQVAAYSAHVSDHADPNALYVVMIGGNDVRNVALEPDPGTGAGAITEGVDTELAAISALSGEGAEHFLVVNVPNVGLIPEFAEDDASRAGFATQLSQMYDADLAQGLHTLDPTLAAGTTLTDFNLYDFNASILPKAAALGFTNTTDPCFTDTPGSATATTACGPDGANVDHFLFWDDIHPTAPVQALWAGGLRSAVPEPSTWAMLVIGFVGLGFAGYCGGARVRAAA